MLDIGTVADAVNRLFSPKYSISWGYLPTTKWWSEHKNDKDGIRPATYLPSEYICNNFHISAHFAVLE